MRARRLLGSASFGADLGLGIGVSAAVGVGVFSAAVSFALHVFFPALPFSDPENLLLLEHVGPGAIEESHPDRIPTPVADELLRGGDVFSSVVLFKDNQLLVLRGVGPVGGVVASHDFLPTLGVTPVLGRSFTPEEDLPGRGQVMVVSYDFWQRSLGGRNDVLGLEIHADYSGSFTIVGVLPEGFTFPVLRHSSVYLPLGAGVGQSFLRQPVVSVFARPAPGIGQAEVGRFVDRAVARWSSTQPSEDGVAVQIRARPYRGGFYASEGLGLVGAILLAAGLLLGITVLNIATLSALGLRRRLQDFAIRAALGAGMGRMTAFVIARAGAPVVVGSLLGLSACFTMLAHLRRTATPENAYLIPQLDVRSTLVAVSVLAAVTLVAVVGPTARMHGRQLSHLLANRGAGWIRSRLSVLRVAVGGQVAVVVCLLVLGTLFARAVDRFVAEDRGFVPEQRVAVSLSSNTAVDVPLVRALEADEYLSRGGVAIGVPPIHPLPESTSRTVRVAGQPAPRGRHWILGVSDRYADVLGMAVREGRFLTPAEVAGGEPVAVVDTDFARRLWPDRPAIGQVLEIARSDETWAALRVVGTTDRVRLTDGRTGLPMHQLFVPYSIGSRGSNTLVIRMADGMTPSGVWASLDRYGIVAEETQVLPLEEMIARTAGLQVLSARALGVTASLGLLVALVGLFCVLGHAAQRRESEFGVRRALGSTRTQITTLAVGDGLRLALTGTGVGLVLGVGVAAWLRPLLLGVPPADPLALLVVAALVVGASALACLGPALKAASADPIQLMRVDG